ncbi:GIY-YIG nuclease family protein [Nostoc sp. LEGE 12447]|uniref:GIY-YIG nuclease family protein n=1 Tax=Nostoc sp. LEGE 12447 TaxID=1828640 RepID=UPI0018846B85|nr:GIY-YIG nuclease family protein [Nostoc sp. LEGE 12447]MBE9003422.1 GIY-YIG nuclease family protein [Nostoc sp. LEGE 12447]
MEPNQLNLFSEVKPTPVRRAEGLLMSGDALLKWKAQILHYQQRVRESKPPEQTALFDITPNRFDPDAIDPFTLPLQSMAFYRMPTDAGNAAIYFVSDNAMPLLLYVDETRRSGKRWKGEHGCKQYLDSYHSLHHHYGLQRSVSIAFWWDAPTDRRARQELELNLILKWRSPFNKENCVRWGQPFG